MATGTFDEWLQITAVDSGHGPGVQLHIGFLTRAIWSSFGINPPYCPAVGCGVSEAGSGLDKIVVICRRGRSTGSNTTATVLNADRVVIGKILAKISETCQPTSSLVCTCPDTSLPSCITTSTGTRRVQNRIHRLDAVMARQAGD